MEILWKLGFRSKQERHLDDIFKAMKDRGEIDLLTNQAKLLREQNQYHAMVFDTRYVPSVMIQLRWGLDRLSTPSASTYYRSNGIALESSNLTSSITRFTDGMSWNYLDDAFKGGYRLNTLRGRVPLTPEEVMIFKHGMVKNHTLEEQIQLAIKVAQPQSDYRYGDRPGGKIRHDSKFRVIH